MTREEEIRARLEKATPGPWKYNDHDARMGAIVTDDRINDDVVWADGDPYACVRISEEDAAFIANAPSDIDYLLKENQRLQQSIEDWISGEQGRKLREENQRLRGALAAIPNMPWSMVNSHVRQALEGETK